MITMADTPLCSLYNLCSFFATIVKLPEPVIMAALWSDHKLKLTWPSQGDSASAEVLVRHVENKTQTWSHVSNDEYNICFTVNMGVEWWARGYDSQLKDTGFKTQDPCCCLSFVIFLQGA